MKAMIRLALMAIWLGSAGVALADSPATQPVHLPTNTMLHDQKDRPVTPLDLRPGHRAVVLIFISTDCPISNGYAPAIGEICRKFTPLAIDFFTVYEDSSLSAAAASAHHDEYAFPCDALLDPQQALAHLAGATVTPQALVVTSGGLLVYRGRIDNQYVSVGKKRFSATTHELQDVLTNIAATQPVTTSWMPAVGCTIP